MVSVRRPQGADIAGDTRSDLLFSRNQITRLSPCTRKGGLSPEGLDLGCLPSPQRQWRSQRWGSAIIHIPHAVELKSWGFLPSPPTQGLGAKYISHCTQHMRGGEATWEGTGEWEKPPAGGYRPLRNTACHKYRLGGPGNPSSPSAAGMEDGLNKHLISSCCAEALGEAGSGSAETGHHTVTPSRGQVHRKEVESRRAVMLSW